MDATFFFFFFLFFPLQIFCNSLFKINKCNDCYIRENFKNQGKKPDNLCVLDYGQIKTKKKWIFEKKDKPITKIFFF